ncbi:hypothetical protein [Neptuniibacter sp.]|uniref:hypothetical protein n=1 Tax=Neptuniibacter sp. TaxID=1962643 RepID=UPI003B5A65E5
MGKLYISKGHPRQSGVVKYEVDGFDEFLDNHNFRDFKVSKDKFDWDIRSFHACGFKNNSKNRVNAEDIWILAVDVDNKPEYSSLLTPEEVKEKLHNVHINEKKDPWHNLYRFKGLRFFMYSTHSHTAEVPRFRILIPLTYDFLHLEHACNVSHEDYKHAFGYIYRLFSEHPALDDAVSHVSQSFNQPSAHPDRLQDAFIYDSNENHERLPGACLGWSIVEGFGLCHKGTEHSVRRSGIQYKKDSTAHKLIDQDIHRRERLNKIICAQFLSGASIDDTVQKVFQYDMQVHKEVYGEAHYEKERYGGRDPEAVANEHVEQEFAILARKHEPLEKESGAIFADF